MQEWCYPGIHCNYLGEGIVQYCAVGRKTDIVIESKDLDPQSIMPSFHVSALHDRESCFDILSLWTWRCVIVVSVREPLMIQEFAGS